MKIIAVSTYAGIKKTIYICFRLSRLAGAHLLLNFCDLSSCFPYILHKWTDIQLLDLLEKEQICAHILKSSSLCWLYPVGLIDLIFTYFITYIHVHYSLLQKGWSDFISRQFSILVLFGPCVLLCLVDRSYFFYMDILSMVITHLQVVGWSPPRAQKIVVPRSKRAETLSRVFI